ncbi:MAG: maleylpyruvate isomerase family mycothiol-dependent enzyme [Actinomycetes bacterium]
MTTTARATTTPRESTLDRSVAMRLAATEYHRLAELLRELDSSDWTKSTDCPAWDVRALVAHNLGMAEMSASIFEQRRQMKAARKAGGLFIDALTDVQVRKHTAKTSDELATAYTAVGPKAAKARRRTPGFIRRRTLPVPQHVNDVDEVWRLGYLIDVVLTRDVWMHRVDITRATGKTIKLTSDHDGVLVDNVVNEWADRHDQPFTLHLDGPAGGSWARGEGGAELRLDAVEFCRILSRRADGAGLLKTEVPF